MIEPGTYRYPSTDRIIFGDPWGEVLADEVARRNARRVLVLASATLVRTSPLERELQDCLGQRLRRLHCGVRAHTPFEDVITATEAARAVDADLIVTIGGGSVTDAGKLLQLCLAAGVRDKNALDQFRAGLPEPGIPSWPVRMVSIPTTLSGAEFTAMAGATDLTRRLKQSFAHPHMIPESVILDPRITLPTPTRLWLSTGMRAVDHAIETLCSIRTQPLFEASAARALTLLAASLPRTKGEPANLEARLDSLFAVWLSLIGPQAGAPLGASHGIGHVLGGTAEVPHGFTSCIMLPHVLRFNREVNFARQRLVSAALGHPDADAGDLVADLVRRLELPTKLREVGVGHQTLTLIAENSMHDRWIPTNPRRIAGPQDVLKLLEAAW